MAETERGSWNDRVAIYLSDILVALGGTGGGAVIVDDAAFTPGTSKVDMSGAFFNDSSPDVVDEGDGGAVRMSANRSLYVQLRDAAGSERGVNVDGSNRLGVIEGNSGGILTAVQLIDDAVYTDGVGPIGKGLMVMGVDGITPQGLKVNADGELMVNLEAGDIQIGAVELKDADSAVRADIELDSAKNALYVRSESLSSLANQALMLTSLQVMDDWDELNRVKINAIVGQTGIAAGAGAVDATVPRMTLASDDPAVAALEVIDDWDAVHDGAVSTDGPQTMLEAKEFDGAAFPNDVAEGDAVRPAASLYGVEYVKLVSEDGSQSVEDEVNNALRVMEIAAEAQQELAVSLFSSQDVGNADASDQTSGAVNVSAYNSKTVLLNIAKTSTPPDLKVWTEYSPDGTNWYPAGGAAADDATAGIRMSHLATVATLLTYSASKFDSFSLPDWTKYMRLQLRGEGVAGGCYWTVTAELMAHGR